MAEFLAFFILMTVGLIFSELFRRLQLPIVTALIMAGIILGPFFLDLIEPTETLVFLGSIGLIFLMFIAGTEIKLSNLIRSRKKIIIFALLNGLIPFFTGLFIGLLFGYSLITSLLIGTVFISSAIAVIIPSLESKNLTKSKVGKTIISAVVFEDITSIILLSIILQLTIPNNNIPIYTYIPLVLITILVLKLVIPKIEKLFKDGKLGSKLFENELQFILITLIATVLVFELLGIHSILAGFITGLILSESMKRKLYHKIHTLSYGIFIPVFFVMLGVEMNIASLLSFESLILIITIIIGLIGSKIISGYLAGKFIGFNNNQSLLIGVSTIPQLSSSLAAAYAASEAGIISNGLMTSFIIMSITTTLIAPILMNKIIKSEKI